MFKRIHFEDECSSSSSSLTLGNTFNIDRRIEYTTTDKRPPDSEVCGDGKLQSLQNDSTLVIGRQTPEKNGLQQKQLFEKLNRSGKSPFLYPVPNEAGDYIHVYWTNTLRNYLNDIRQRIEDNLEENWKFYHPTFTDIPQTIFLTYNQYIIEPAYRQLSTFICNNDYRYFYLTIELIEELVHEVLRGNIVQKDSIDYITRLLQVYPLSAVIGWFDEYVKQQAPSRSAEKLVSWIKENKKRERLIDSGSRLIKPAIFKKDVEKVFLIKMLLYRLYPQIESDTYDAEVRDMLLNGVYKARTVKQILSSRLRDKRYYDKLQQEISRTFSSKADPANNVELFIEDVETFSIPFKFDVDSVEEAKEFTDSSGHKVYKIIEKKENPINHSMLTNVFIPPPPTSSFYIKKLNVSQKKTLKRISGSHRLNTLQKELGSFDKIAGIAPKFLPSTATEVITFRRVQRCPQPLSPKVCHSRKRRKTTVHESITTYLQLALIFSKVVNAVNKDDLRSLFAEAYPMLINEPLLLSYTTAYGPKITAYMVDKFLRRQVEAQLQLVWDSIEAKVVIHERITPVYIVLALMLNPVFSTFLTPEQQSVAQSSWDGFEATAHQFAESTDSCTVTQPITERKRIHCVLANSIALMRFTPQKLRSYHGKDIAKGS